MAVWQSLVSCQNLSKISTWTLLQLLYWLNTKEQILLHRGRVKFLRRYGLTQRPAAAIIVVFRAIWRASDVSQRSDDRLGKKNKLHLFGGNELKVNFYFLNIGTQDRHIQQGKSTSAHTCCQCDTNFSWTYPCSNSRLEFGCRTVELTTNCWFSN